MIAKKDLPALRRPKRERGEFGSGPRYSSSRRHRVVRPRSKSLDRTVPACHCALFALTGCKRGVINNPEIRQIRSVYTEVQGGKGMRGLSRFAALAFAVLVLAPAAAYAQASIAGVVKDSSGAVLPGVTVEVASPALIEKTRSSVTDGSGLYQIISLPPGTYSVTFSLQGFTT